MKAVRNCNFFFTVRVTDGFANTLGQPRDMNRNSVLGDTVRGAQGVVETHRKNEGSGSVRTPPTNKNTTESQFEG
jgi:hypothetical protein